MPITMCFTIRDAKNLESQTLINIEDLITTDIGGQYDTCEAFQPIIDALIRGYIIRVGLVVPVGLVAGIKTEPEANSDIEEGAKFIWQSETGFTAENRIPTFDESKILPSSKLVDLLDTDVQDFINAVLAQGTDSRGDAIIEVLSAREDFGRSRT